jgi:hypothetical protein
MPPVTASTTCPASIGTGASTGTDRSRVEAGGPWPGVGQPVAAVYAACSSASSRSS